MSIFDPLGMLNPFTIQAKILLQNICRRGTGWDEPIDKIDESEWIAWLNDFSLVKNYQVPRCLFQFDFDPSSVELHTFCDASETAYAAVVYSRAIYKNGKLLFTCLTMRAVHLEIADSLSADSTIMAIQRMTVRRGQPSAFYSDNGTDLRGLKRS